jgi:glycosyltransferase involved in cell wall biosynthesis
LDERFPNCALLTEVPARPFSVALRLSQPFFLQEMLDLHRASLFTAYLMLDTIAWDVMYAAPPHLDATWQFLADYADGFIYDSEFSRGQFQARFRPSASDVVSHFSFDAAEYARKDLASLDEEDFLLVVGNQLDHKDVAPTVDLLASAFPAQPIRVLGPACSASPLVTSIASGHLAEEEIHRLYASARMVIFPSFYEGFGFPIVTALAYDRTILARQSPLLREIASHCDPRHGRLVAFSRREELVDAIALLMRGDQPVAQVTGTRLNGGRPRAWRDVGRDIVAFLARLTTDPAQSRWLTRDKAIRQISSYR